MTRISITDAQPSISFDGNTRHVSWKVNDTLWATSASPLWAVYSDTEVLTAQSPQVQLVNTVHDRNTPGCETVALTFVHTSLQLQMTWYLRSYAASPLCETWLHVANAGDTPFHIERIDSCVIDIPSASYDMLSYTGGWGSEFEPVQQRLLGSKYLEVRSGRSSQGMHPWCALWRDVRSLISVAVAWSGNWIIRFDEQADGGYRMSAGLNDWAFFVDLLPGQAVTAPAVVVVTQDTPDLSASAAAYTDIGRRFWYPRTPLAETLPVEWNHWWTYEDRTLNESVFRANVDAAKTMGVEVCTLDAGWFGPSDPATHWYDYRGDWHIVNTRRFPSGIRALSDYVHAAGMAFGIWCEIEAVGRKSSVNQTHPEIVALRHDTSLGYVCLGSPAGWQWAFDTLDRIIHEYNADWIKLDFNLDPGAGCNRIDHGHGAGDGLLCHYHGYYRLLEAIRTKYPHVVLENCSSGGLRIDLGLARHTHMAFLSDPDWPEHSLQLFWGAATMLAPDALLHWGFCEWGFADHPQQTFDPRDASLTMSQLDYFTHISMLHRFGFSQGLPNLPQWVRQRYQKHIADYQQIVRRFIKTARLVLLTNQPRRNGTLDRFAGFQYVMPDEQEMLIALFRLPGAKAQRRFSFDAVRLDRTYKITVLETQQVTYMPGTELAMGWLFAGVDAPGSTLLLLQMMPD